MPVRTKVLADYPHKFYFDQFCALTHSSQFAPFAEINNRHMALVASKSNYIYGILSAGQRAGLQ